jgi:hypothetical protein
MDEKVQDDLDLIALFIEDRLDEMDLLPADERAEIKQAWERLKEFVEDNI